MNARARAESLIKHYRVMGYGCPGRAEEDQVEVTDILADLMHYAHAKGVDFDQALADAEMHYSAERAEYE